MRRAALIAILSAIALPCAGLTAAEAATKPGFWWSPRAAYSYDAPGRKAKKQQAERPAKPKAARDADNAPPLKGPLHIIVSIDKQRATLFADGEPLAATRISSGTASHPTPMGVFSVIQKRRHHISNLYDAPMPYMHRITWSGAALHEGPLPGYPASHGCVRLTPEFAQLLWNTSKIGARVIITRDEVRPEPIQHAGLDALLLHPAQAERAPDPAPTSALLKTADAGAAAFASAAKRAPLAALPSAPAVSDTPARAPIMPIMSQPAASATDEQATKASAVDGPHEAPVVLAAPPAAADVAPTTPAIAPVVVTPAPVERPAAPDASTQPTNASTALERMRSAAKEQAPPAAPVNEAAKRAETAATAPMVPKSQQEKQAAAAALATTTADVPLPLRASPVREVNRKPVSLFVSLKDGKLYARQGMEPLFDMPISVARPDQPLGTHVFTAMSAKDGGGPRWTVVSIPSSAARAAEPAIGKRSKSREARVIKKLEEPAPPVPAAAEALDRIVMPAQAMERIAGLIMPGSSLIVSDNRLSDETSDSTEFIVTTR